MIDCCISHTCEPYLQKHHENIWAGSCSTVRANIAKKVFYFVGFPILFKKKSVCKTHLSSLSSSSCPSLLMKSLLSMKNLLKCRQWCCCHCSVYLWESRSEIRIRWKRREISFGVRWCPSPACCMSSQFFFSITESPCTYWFPRWDWALPSLGWAGSGGSYRDSRRPPRATSELPQQTSIRPVPETKFLTLPSHFKRKESSVPSHELSTASAQPCAAPSITQIQLYMQLHSKSRLRNWSWLKKEATPCKWTLKFSFSICSKTLLDWGWCAGSETPSWHGSPILAHSALPWRCGVSLCCPGTHQHHAPHSTNEIQSNSRAVQSKGTFLWASAEMIPCKICFFFAHTEDELTETTQALEPRNPCVWPALGRGLGCVLSMDVHLDSPSHGHPGGTESSSAPWLLCRSSRKGQCGAGRAPGDTKAVFLLKSWPCTVCLQWQSHRPELRPPQTPHPPPDGNLKTFRNPFPTPQSF